jgi:hypothetical protein
MVSLVMCVNPITGSALYAANPAINPVAAPESSPASS